MKKLKKFVWQSLNAVEMGGAVQLVLQSALKENGWFRSFHTKQSVDKQGKPIPWCTYPFIHFIEPRLNKRFEVFEFGCGNSTLWYASKVKNIKAVEHDESWVQLMQSKLPSNAKVIYRSLTDNNTYPEEVKQEGKKYHVIIIDGRKRNKCALQAVNYLTTDGVVIWDNSHIAHYASGINHLLSLQFKRIDFWGMSPIISHLNCTSIFYKPDNCLQI